MKIYLRELSNQDTDLDFTQAESWVSEAVARLDEKDVISSHRETPPTAPQKSQPRKIQVHFNLRLVDEVVVINGDIDTEIKLLCSRCAGSYSFHSHPHFSALFCKDPAMAGIAHLQEGTGKPMGQNKGFARHAHDSREDANVESGMDLDITYISTDSIDLADVITEQLQLLLPFQPLCQESCKGMCAHCGADLNLGRCACAKLATAHPFSVLKDLKVKP